MGYVIKEVKPGVFELVFEAEAAAPIKPAEGKGKKKEKEEEEEQKKEEKEVKKEEEKKEDEEEEPIPVAETSVLKSCALSRLLRDLKEIHEFPLPTVNAAPLENNMFEWHANLVGSSDTLFCGMVFHLVMKFPENYPFSPPKVRLMNNITHPNVFGEYICLDMLEDGMWRHDVYKNAPYTGWTTAYSVQSILVQLQAFFSMEAYEDEYARTIGFDRAHKSIETFHCACGHKKTNIWPPIAESAIKAIKAEREAMLKKTGRRPDPIPKPITVGDEEKKEEPKEAKKEEPKKEEPKEEKKEETPAAPAKQEQAAPASKPKPVTVEPIVTPTGLIPLRRYLPEHSFLPRVGKRIGFGDKTTIELQFHTAKQYKKFRDSEIELKSSDNGFLYELPINEPPPRSETKDIIYFWGEVYPVDEVDTEHADPVFAARRAAGIPTVKNLTVGEILKSRPLNIPKRDTLTVTLTDAGGINPLRPRTKHVFKTVYNLEHYDNVKTAGWQLFAIEKENPNNYLVLNLKSNTFNLHFLSSVQYFVRVEKKKSVEKEEEKGKKAVNDKGKRQPAKKDGAQEKGAKPGPAKAAKEQKEQPAAAAKGKAPAKPAGDDAKGDAKAAAPAAKGKGKQAQAKDQPEPEAQSKSKRDQEPEVPVKKYVPPPSTPLFISTNFGAPPPVPAAQRRRDRKGKDKVDLAPGGRRGNARDRAPAPVGTGKGKEKEGAPVVPKEEKPATEGVPAAQPSGEQQPAIKELDAASKAVGSPVAGAGEGKGQRGRGRRNRKDQAAGETPKEGAKEPAKEGVPEAGAAPAETKEQGKQGPKKQGQKQQQQQQQQKGERKTSKKSNFNRLPAEIRSHIFSFLGKKDLYRASNVSHDFEALALGILAQTELFCYHTKLTFKEDTLGIGVTYKYYPKSTNIESISSTLDLLSTTAFHVDKVRKSVWKIRFNDWLPLYISYRHGIKAIPLCEESICRLLTGSKVGFEPKMAITIFTKLMNTMIVNLMNGQAWASEKALEGYFAFHHWLLVFLERYPSLLDWINETIGNFIKEERYRTKKVVPALGEFLPLLALTDKYHWKDIAEAYLLENFDRNQKWVLKTFPYLGNLANEKEPVDKKRIICTQNATVVSQRLLMFHVFFLNHIAKPKGSTVADMKRMYDESYGRPSERLKSALQLRVKDLQKISNWIEFFNLIEMPLPTPKQLTYWLRQSVRNSAKKRYHHWQDYAGKTRQKKKKAQGSGSDNEEDPYDY